MMPDEISMSEDAEEIDAAPPIVHDDIMQRLLDYQRQLREGLTPEQAAAESAAAQVLVDEAPLEAPAPIATQTETVEVVDLVAIEDALEKQDDNASQIWAVPNVKSEPTPIPSVPDAATDASRDLAARLAKLEDTLSSVAVSIGDLRAQFQNMAIAADDRLAAIESTLARAKGEAAAS